MLIYLDCKVFYQCTVFYLCIVSYLHLNLCDIEFLPGLNSF